jgi:hypothetical protein
MMPYAIKKGGQWQEINGPFTVGEGAEEVSYPTGWCNFVTQADRTAIGVKAIVEPIEPPAGFQAIGSTIVDADGWPTREWVLQPIDISQPRQATFEAARAYRETMIEQGKGLLACHGAWMPIREAIAAAATAGEIAAIDVTVGYPE